MPIGESLEDEKLYLIHYNMFFKPWKYEEVMFDKYFWDVAKTTTFYDFIKQKQQSYTDEQKKQDSIAAENLLKMAVNIANSDNTYRVMVLNKPRNVIEDVQLRIMD